MSILHYSIAVPNTSNYYGAHSDFVSVLTGSTGIIAGYFVESDGNENSKIHLLRIGGSKTNIVAHMRNKSPGEAIVNWAYRLIKEISAPAPA
jgi:hypothetical protein